MPVTILINKPIDMPKMIRELSAAGFHYIDSRPGEFITIEDSDDKAAVQVVYDAHDANPSAAELETIARKAGAKAIAQTVGSWFTWDVAQMSDWVQTNIGSPLANGRANLPASITLANIRPILIAFLDILDKMLVMMIALAKMEIALRDDKWPEQNNPTIK